MTITDTTSCPRCARTVDLLDHYCRYCGARQGEAAWYHTQVFVLASAFLFLGPLALPLLWRSTAFSRNAKAIWSLAICLYTLAIVAAGVIILRIYINYILSRMTGV